MIKMFVAYKKYRWINKFDYLGSIIFCDHIGFKSGRLL